MFSQDKADGRTSTASSLASRNVRNLTRMKRVKIFLAFSVLFVMYVCLYGSDASDNIFLVVGGFLGGVSAVSVQTDESRLWLSNYICIVTCCYGWNNSTHSWF